MHLENDKINGLFKQLQGSFDTEDPKEGHQLRFLEKLKDGKPTIAQTRARKLNWLKPLAIAASLILMVGLYFGKAVVGPENELASVAPKMQETQTYFTSLIQQELNKIRVEQNEDTKVIVQDALVQLKKLEEDYAKLTADLLKNSTDKRILFAMITNLQNRASLLENVLIQIEEVKNLKLSSDENTIT